MPSASTAAKRDKSYTLRQNDLISVAECNALIEKRVRQFGRRVLRLMLAGFAVLAAIVVLAIRWP